MSNPPAFSMLADRSPQSSNLDVWHRCISRRAPYHFECEGDRTLVAIAIAAADALSELLLAFALCQLRPKGCGQDSGGVDFHVRLSNRKTQAATIESISSGPGYWQTHTTTSRSPFP